MAESLMVGTRIRERRMMSGLRQAELARRAGISASYLNLIEHNRRRIGGRTLLKLAEVLEVEASVLSDGAEAALINGLRQAAARSKGVSELDRTEEFAGRFPGWARLLSDLSVQREGLEGTVKTLTDRLTHDPHLADALHEVISTVTAIRSTASILAGSQSIEPEWQQRFHRNINEDGRRLAEAAEGLVRYLEGAPDTETEIKSPQDELNAFLTANGFHFPMLEEFDGEGQIKDILGQSEAIETPPAHWLAQAMLEQYVADARALPLQMLKDHFDQYGIDPEQLANMTGCDLPVVFRRLAMLPEDLVGPVGLVICDGTGMITLRKPALGFEVPRSPGACALWPLYQVLAQPGMPLRQRLRQGEVNVLVFAAAETARPAGFDLPALIRPHMLLLPDGETATVARQVGTNCPICEVPDCPARREPSILSTGF